MFEKLVGTKNIKPRHYLTLSLKKSIPKKAKDYVITVRQVSGTPGSRLTFSLNGKGYEWRDLYTDGYFIRNTRALKNEDLQFKVYRLLYKPYISQKMYFTLFSIPVCMLLFYTIIYFVVSKRKMMRKS
ncbi:hypothetical protein QS257_14715 [Terrilactibacillus sp. S3-3]|nr:hypothetical protein QS257_14715 [Terrilactibacillus sp. S3-3]